MTRDQLLERKAQHSRVPCGDCRACCKQDRILLGKGDDLLRLKWHLEDGVPVVDRKDDGQCIYLGKSGCSIHKNAPNICKRFDCRVLFLTTPKAQRRIRIEQNPTMRAVYEAGKTRAATLESHECLI